MCTIPFLADFSFAFVSICSITKRYKGKRKISKKGNCAHLYIYTGSCCRPSSLNTSLGCRWFSLKVREMQDIWILGNSNPSRHINYFEQVYSNRHSTKG